MTDKLKPLSEAEAELFSRRRESAAVVQEQCKCGAWYETPKRDHAFTEGFTCEQCGRLMQYSVPAMDGIRPLSFEERLELADPGARLDTGMTAREATDRAARWWNKRGRFLLVDMETAKRFASADPDDPRFLPSGILNGHAWDMLGKREQIMIVKVHHHFTVRNPDLIGGDPDQKHRPQDRDNLN
jgi:hypothetical protein